MSQQQHVIDLLKETGMLASKPVANPVRDGNFSPNPINPPLLGRVWELRNRVLIEFGKILKPESGLGWEWIFPQPAPPR